LGTLFPPSPDFGPEHELKSAKTQSTATPEAKEARQMMLHRCRELLDKHGRIVRAVN
jgi:hypothetical protein